MDSNTTCLVPQLCDKGNEVKFMSHKCTVTSLKNGETILTAWRSRNMCVADLVSSYAKGLICFSIQDDATEL